MNGKYDEKAAISLALALSVTEDLPEMTTLLQLAGGAGREDLRIWLNRQVKAALAKESV